MTRLLPLLAATCAAALLAAGCTSDKPSPNYSSVTPTPSTSTSPTPTESPSPTSFPTTGPNVNPGEVAPTEPPGADARTSEGAMSFLAYYYKLSDWAFATSQAQFLEPLFAPGCAACEEGQSNLASLFSNGNYVTGGRIMTQSIQLVENDGRDGAEFAVTGVFSVSAAQVHSSDGAVVKTFPASDRFQLTDWVKWSDNRWLIVDEGKA